MDTTHTHKHAHKAEEEEIKLPQEPHQPRV